MGASSCTSSIAGRMGFVGFCSSSASMRADSEIAQIRGMNPLSILVIFINRSSVPPEARPMPSPHACSLSSKKPAPGQARASGLVNDRCQGY